MTQEAVMALLIVDLDKHIGNAKAWVRACASNSGQIVCLVNEGLIDR
jgi:hypothetical protein